MIIAAHCLHPIGVTKNSVDVFVNLTRSAASEHIAHQPQMLSLAKEVLALRTVTGNEPTIEHDFGRTVGNSEIIATTAKDTIVYAKRLKHDSYCRFVRKRQPAPSSFLSMTLIRAHDNSYELTDIWIGKLVPPFPDGNTDSQSSVFWENHAIVFEGQALQLRTLTKELPY